MSDWYYLERGSIRDETVGPIDTETLAKRIRGGEIKLDTPVSSPQKTGNKWVTITAFPKLIEIHAEGERARTRERERQKEAKKEERERKKQAKKEAKLAAKHEKTLIKQQERSAKLEKQREQTLAQKDNPEREFCIGEVLPLKPNEQAVNLNPQSSKSVLVCAFGLLVAFFLPWVQLLGVGMSGYNLGQIGSYGNYAWVIPILAAATILVSLSGMNNRALGAFSGIVPLGAILYSLIRIAGEGGPVQDVLKIAGHILSIGGWLTIIFSVAIIISAAVEPPASSTGTRQPEA